MSTKGASPAQARRLAWLFSGEMLHVSDKLMDPTVRALVRSGWVTATGETGTYPSGRTYALYRINEAGELALERHLGERRIKRRMGA